MLVDEVVIHLGHILVSFNTGLEYLVLHRILVGYLLYCFLTL